VRAIFAIMVCCLWLLIIDRATTRQLVRRRWAIQRNVDWPTRALQRSMKSACLQIADVTINQPASAKI
jgi:hypothetical protein